MNKVTINKSHDIAGIVINGKKRISTVKEAYLTTKHLIIEEYGWDKAFEFEDNFTSTSDINGTLKRIGLK